MTFMKNRTATGWCEYCRKLMYIDRKAARHVAKAHPQHKSPYRCPYNDMWWHIGGLPRDIVKGHFTRAEFYGESA